MRNTQKYLLIAATLISSQILGVPEGVRISFVTDLQTNKTVWKEVAQGAQLAADELRRTDKDFKFEMVDSGPGAAGTRNAMLTLMKNPPDLVIAEIDSSKAAVAAEIANQNQRVLITPFATSPRITEEFPYAFRACPSDNMIARVIADFSFNALNAKKVAVVYDAGQLYSATLKESFEKEIITRGGKVVYSKPILSSSNSYEEEVREIIANAPDVIFLPFYEETVGRFISSGLKDPNFRNITLLGGDGWAQVSFLSKENDPRLKDLKAYWVTHHHPDPIRKKAVDFIKNFKERYKVAPETSAAYLGYDSVIIGHKTLASFKTKPSQLELKKALSHLQGVNATTGVISFNGSNEPSKPIYLLSHKNGKIAFEKELRP